MGCRCSGWKSGRCGGLPKAQGCGEQTPRHNYLVRPADVQAVLLRSPPPHRLADIEMEVVEVALRKGEHRKAPYLSINPLGKVPALQVRCWGTYY